MNIVGKIFFVIGLIALAVLIGLGVTHPTGDISQHASTIPNAQTKQIVEPDVLKASALDVIASEEAARVAAEQQAQQQAEQQAAQRRSNAQKQANTTTKQQSASSGTTSAQSSGNYAGADAWASSGKSQSVIQCESGGNYNINTGNGYYGAWQFDYSSWHANGGGQYAQYPHQATPSQQNQVAYNYYQKAGWRPWACG